ncbi:MAG TPA: PQQ-binding-like beta-propeller repeat protein [Verrucomicrobiae bacterium]|nr:PQQ-binding-like beta-propeller repeat protein [Verrucomicrobiae bacterium]
MKIQLAPLGFFFALSLAATTLQARGDDWPQWRGPLRNGHAASDAPAINSLPTELHAVWKIRVGGGFSSPVISANKLLYLDEQNGQEHAHLLDTSTGKEIWNIAYAPVFQDEWGAGPRSTPIIDDDRAYVLSCTGEFRCLNLADGKTIWQTSFERDFGVKFLGSKANEGTASRRGNNGSGVIHGDAIIVPVGSQNGASLVAFNKRTGKVLWKSQNDEAAYSSLIAATLAGAEQILAFSADALLAVAPDDGHLLWRVPFKTDAKRHAASPVIFGDTVTVNSQTIGLVCERITRDSSASFKASDAWINKQLKINLATPVEVDGYFYSEGVQGDYVCVDARTGKLQWSQPGFGKPDKKDYASTIVVKQNLLILTYNGQLILAAANPAKYREIARLQVCGNTWSHPAYAQGRLYVRDGRELLALQLAGSDSALKLP